MVDRLDVHVYVDMLAISTYTCIRCQIPPQCHIVHVAVTHFSVLKALSHFLSQS